MGEEAFLKCTYIKRNIPYERNIYGVKFNSHGRNWAYLENIDESVVEMEIEEGYSGIARVVVKGIEFDKIKVEVPHYGGPFETYVQANEVAFEMEPAYEITTPVDENLFFSILLGNILGFRP